MLLKNKYEKIANYLKSNNILAETEECYCYSKDASNLSDSNILPDLVIFVENTDDVQRVMKHAFENDIPVVSRGAGTNTVGACTCPKGGIVLNFSKMNKIIDINSSNMTAVVQPGVVLGELKSEVEAKGLFFPPDPSNFKVSTVGGGIAQSSGGASSFKYGTMKDYVLSLKVVTSDGKLITLGANTIKDSVGYHLSQLMVGSEGTLAIIVEATLKLIPKPETRRVVLAYFDDINMAVSGVNNIISSNIFPKAVEFMDKNSIMTVEDYAKCGLKQNKAGLLLVEIDGFEVSMGYQMSKIVDAFEKSGFDIKNDIVIANSEAESEALMQARRVSYAAATRLAPDVVTDDIIVPRENLGKMISSCLEISDKYSLKMCLIGHVGDGNLHPQVALNLNNDDEYKNYMDAKAEMYRVAIDLGGTISAEHGIGSDKKHYIRNAVDSNSIEFMKMIKRIFDPKNLLNPDKIFDI